MSAILPQAYRKRIQRHKPHAEEHAAHNVAQPVHPCHCVKGLVDRGKAHPGAARPDGPHIHMANKERPQRKRRERSQRNPEFFRETRFVKGIFQKKL